MNPEQLKIYKRDKSRQFNANLKALRLEKKHSSPGTASPAKPAEPAKPPAESGLILEDLYFKIEELESKLTNLLDVKFDELLDRLTDLLDVKLEELESKLIDLLEDTEELDDQLETKPRPPFQLQQNAFA